MLKPLKRGIICCPVSSPKSWSSSGTLSFFWFTNWFTKFPLWLRVLLSYRLMLCLSCWNFGTFLAASCFPPSNQNVVILMLNSFVSLWQPLRASWYFSTRRRFLHACHRLILRWKNLLKSSIFSSMPRESAWEESMQESQTLLHVKLRTWLQIVWISHILKMTSDTCQTWNLI